MGDYIADLLAQNLINLDWISRTAGNVTELSLQVKKDIIKKIPAAILTYSSPVAGTVQCDRPDKYADMIPNDNEIGIIYFEDQGSKCIDTDSRISTWSGSLKLVCWLNMKRIGEGNGIGDLTNATISSLPTNIAASGVLYGGTLKALEVLKKRPSPFELYDYDEVDMQYLMFPYDYFSVMIEFRVKIGRNCPVPININPILCP